LFKRGRGRQVCDSPEDSDEGNTNEDEDVRSEKLRVLEYFDNPQPNEKCVVALKVNLAPLF